MPDDPPFCAGDKMTSSFFVRLLLRLGRPLGAKKKLAQAREKNAIPSSTFAFKVIRSQMVALENGSSVGNLLEEVTRFIHRSHSV